MNGAMLVVTIFGVASGLTFAVSEEEKGRHPLKAALRSRFLKTLFVLFVITLAASWPVSGTWPFLDVDTERAGAPELESILIFLAQGSGTGALALVAGYGSRLLGRLVRRVVRAISHG